MRIIINSEKELVNQIREGLRINNGYCPCSVIKNEDTKCMCKEFREQSKSGYCHCGLYYKDFEEIKVMGL